MTDEQQIIELRSAVKKVEGELGCITGLRTNLKLLEDKNTELKGDLGKLRKEILELTQRSPQRIRKHEVVTHDCAGYLASVAYIGAEKYNKLSHLNSQSRELILNKSAETLGMELRTALTTTDIPLPTEKRAGGRLFPVPCHAEEDSFPFSSGQGRE